MIAAGLSEQSPELAATSFATEEVGSDLAVPPGTPAADAPVEPEPAELDETARLLAASQAHNAELVAENAALVAQVAQLEAQKEERWMLLKPAAGTCRPPMPYEYARRRAEDGEIKARCVRRPGKTRGLWYAEVNSMEEYQRRRFAK